MSELSDLQKYLTEYLDTTSFDKEATSISYEGEDNDNDEEENNIS